MNSKVALFFLFCCVCGKEGAITTQFPSEYPPCDNQILFGIDNSNNVDANVFQKQRDFLANYTFNEWNNFEHLALYSISNISKFGDLKTKAVVKAYIRSIQQIDEVYSTCDKISELLGFFLKDTRIVLFSNEFQLPDVEDKCIVDLKGLVSRGNSLAFVPLSNAFNSTVLTHYFKQAKIIEWDIEHSDTPDDWEKQFDDFYDCKDQKATTVAHSTKTTTADPTNSYPPCDNQIVIAFDKSNGLTKEEYKQMQIFLTEYIFQNWTRFDNLNSFFFDDHIYSNALPFKDNAELTDFIRNEEQTNAAPDLCNFLNIVQYFGSAASPFIIFLSKLNETDFEEEAWIGYTCQEYIDSYLAAPITFVLLNDDITDILRHYIPQAQIIRLDVFNIPNNWDWQFNNAYGCIQDDYNDKSAYPCNSKFIFVYEVSSEVNETVLDDQRKFLVEGVFNSTWNVFDNLALIAYSNETIIQDFGTLKNLTDVHDFINTSTEQNLNASRTSLCSVFKHLTMMFIQDVNIILFVNEFHEEIGSECPLWIKQLRENINSINFVSLTNQMDTVYLASHFSQAIFTSWNTTMPDKWGLEFYGCQNFVFNGAAYPCENHHIKNIVYDKSYHLSPIAYQKLQYFLLNRVLIKQWSDFDDTYIYNYPNGSKIYISTKMKLELSIRQSLKNINKDEPLFCKALTDVYERTSNTIFFVSKFDQTVLVTNDECNRTINYINDHQSKISFVTLGPLVNKAFLQQTFPNVPIAEWNIEQDEEFVNWIQFLWTAFGCSGSSPIVFPHSTSTVAPTTKSSTSTAKSSTMPLVSTTKASTTKKSSTTTLITSTAPIASSKSSNSGSNSKEKILLGVFIPLIIIILIVVIVCFCFYRRKKRQQLVENMVSNKFYKENEYCGEEREEDPWEISFDCLNINFMDKIGSGAFGDVFIGKLVGSAPIKRIYSDSPHCQRFHDCDIAIKSLPQMQVDDYARNEFQKEIEFMKGLKFHPNLVCFLGYVYDPTSPLMLLEYCANGDLLKFIKTNKQKFVESFESQEENTDCKILISFALQISSGLEHLSSLDLIHRDVAARNILLDAQNVCKVSDFGLCRLAEDLTYQSKGGKLPIRWMALESLKVYVYSQKTDVWSYGVLLYELFTLGDLPYVHVENILAFIESGKRLNKPQYCSEDIYNLMSSCWLVDPEERPTFTIICQLLTKMMETATMHYNYVDTLALIEEANQIETIDSDSVNI